MEEKCTNVENHKMGQSFDFGVKEDCLCCSTKRGQEDEQPPIASSGGDLDFLRFLSAYEALLFHIRNPGAGRGQSNLLGVVRTD